jgi:hypothetical protein
MDTGKNKRKEGIILAAVAIVGLGGLLLLQMVRKDQTAGADEKILVQGQANPGKNTAPESQSNLQKVPVNLLRESEQPEMNVPFVYELADFSKGGVYQLDPGDGSGLRTFQDGKLTYTYRKPGVYSVSIYAVDQDKSYKIITVAKQVANLTETKNVHKKSGKPVLDF